MSGSFIDDERISIKEALLRVLDWIRYLFSKWLIIIIGAIVFGSLFATIKLLKTPAFTARTTFVLESGSNSASSVSTIASAVGIPLSNLGGENELFDSDHILELYKSYRMLKMTFLSYKEIEGESTRLITRFLQGNGVLEDWNKEKGLEDFTFEIPEVDMGIVHDSLLMVVAEGFRKGSMIVEKPDRRLSILQVLIVSEDQLFAKAFNEEIVKNVNAFYLETKTKKTAANLSVLQRQADSVRQALESTLLRFGKATEERPNPNPVLATNLVNYQKLKIDIETTTVVYEEVMRQLEIAKITHMESIPLIQIIDSPILPLENNKDSLLKAIVVGLFIGGVLMVVFFTGRRIYRALLAD
ncbi:MAG: exopolysaccharide biosynthesis protein [Bacteroidota bacterium]